MMSKLEQHYHNLNNYFNLVTFLHKLNIINSNRFMSTIIELHNKPHHFLLGG